MLKNRVPRRGRNAPPFDVVLGVTVETWVGFQVHRYGQVQERTYFHDSTVAECVTELKRGDGDRRAWEEHWWLRSLTRRVLHMNNGPLPLPEGVQKVAQRRRRG